MLCFSYVLRKHSNLLIFYFRILTKLIILLFATLSSGSDYYDLLDITKDADNKEIRKAFKKLAVTLHPDKNQVHF